ncbi:MAG: sodium:proton exchanger [Lachnospiraceae bacterium]|uniref:Na+/H+ antiporter NhaC family protein n=1 Tax=Candidatus Merdisoma sp. JLR.KK006 TaxID=3112626 RepID=UPI002FF02198|nr:sodium:proton exchanger [Lachnospiraceae bacterium]
MNYGWLSLLPPIVAVVMAIKSKNVILSLFCGGFVGTMIFCMGNPFLAVKSMIGDYFFVQLTDSYNAGVIVLVIFIGGFIKLMEKSGGARAFSKFVYRFVNTGLKAQMCAWAGGILIFFSDLGTPLLVGPVFRPLFDKLKISREKLAWILDSTSSPVAILIPFIGWGVYIMGLIQAEFENLNIAQSDYTTFVQAIPFQIYAILAILMIPLIAFTGKDFSQMRKAEKRTVGSDFTAKEKQENKIMSENGEYSIGNARPSMVILPIVVVFVTLFVTLAPLGFPFQKVDGNAFRVALTMGYFFGALVLMALIRVYKVKTFQETFKLYVDGMKGMTDVAVTLVLAWSLGGMISGLGTADFIVNGMKAVNFSAGLIPAAIFLFGTFVSFSTGSSWGTFAIMMPLAIPMAHAFSIPYAIAVGAVLSGGLFGDHCSPISDTTILSSTGAECDLVEHVKTQLPYALVNGVIAFGAYLFAGFTGSNLAVVLAVIALFGVIFVWNKKEHADSAA